MSIKELRKINQNHIYKAIEVAKELGLSPSSKYDLLYEGKRFPPAEIIRIASKEANGKEISTPATKEFYSYLIELGFEVISKETNQRIGKKKIGIINKYKMGFDFPELKPENENKSVLKVYQEFEKNVRDKAVYEYLFESKDRKLIHEQHILNSNKVYSWKNPVQAIFRFIGITKRHKGLFVGYSIEEAINILENQEHDVESVLESLSRIKQRNVVNVLPDDNMYSSDNDISDSDLHEYENNSSRNQDVSKVTIQRLVRDSKVARFVKSLYNSCQLCETQINNAKGEIITEAHHLKPYNRIHKGDDTINNLIVLCPNCHAQFDSLYYSINPVSNLVYCVNQLDYKHLKKLKFAERHSLGKKYLEYAWDLFINNNRKHKF